MIDIAEAERQLVGLAMREPSILADCSDIQPSHFVDASLGELWGVLSRLHDAGEYRSDITILVREAKRQNVYSRVGGSAGIAKLFGSAGLASSAVTHAADIRTDAERRRLLRVLTDAVQSLSCTGTDVDAIRSLVDAELSAFKGAASGVQSIEDLVAELVAAAGNPVDSSPGIATGLPLFDRSTGGLHPGELVIVAARPSVGKSALAAGIGLHASTEGHRVLFVSLEMTGRDIAARFLAAESGVSFSSIRSGTAVASKLADASGAFTGLPFRLWSGRGLTTERLRAVCLEQSRGGLDLVIVDYIGLIAPSDKRKPRWESVTEISSDLKSLALSMKVPVIALCQLNRDAEGETPKLSHLRESGAIEQDADIVALLHRDRDASAASLNIAKIRNGQPGLIPLHFDQRATRFTAVQRTDFAEYSR